MTTKFHRAAKDGFVVSLKEATRRDCNEQDEDGLTPIHYAAYEGHLDALRVVAGRGGDPDKYDHFGNTSLHCAAARGHLNCVSFLVNFGANIWALDNELHSAKDLAAINNKHEILRYIDAQSAEQEKSDLKKARKQQEKAKKDAEKRTKEFDKRQKKADKKREDEQLRINKELDKINNRQNIAPTPKKGVFGTLTGNPLSRQPKPENPAPIYASTKFSELTKNAINHKKTISGIKKIVLKKKGSNASSNDFKVRLMNDNNTQYVHSLAGLRRDSEILFVPNAHSTAVSVMKRGKIEDVFNTKLSDKDPLGRTRSVPDFLDYRGSLFDRPGFGSVAFRSTMSATLRDMPNDSIGSLENTYEEIGPNSCESSHSMSPWEEQDLPSEDEEMASPLYLFLVSHQLQNYLPLLVKEHVDLDALILLTEKDLLAINLPLGPRRKMLKAIEQRKDAISNPGEVFDIRL